MAKTSLELTGLSQALQDQQASVVHVVKTSAPYTTVVNRSQMTDLSQDLGARAGSERVMVHKLIELYGERGPSNERVYKPINDVHDQVRFVGEWQSATDLRGARAQPSFNNEYVEVSFYGTGLNLLTFIDTSSRDVSVSVDGGSSSAISIGGASFSTAINDKKAGTNVVIKLVCGLTAGFHTAKIVTNGATYVHGFEILNESLTVKVNKGQSSVGGKVRNLSSQAALTYNSGISGTKGGRVVVYHKSDGTIGQSATSVSNDTPSTSLSNVNHTNEEMVRFHSFREFGTGKNAAGAATTFDDFNILTGNSNIANIAATLDDGTTTLQAATALADFTSSAEGVRVATGTSNFIEITFVGTGIDVILLNPDSSNRQFSSVSVDGGASLGTTTNPGVAKTFLQPIASGLPYGTHTVRMNAPSGINSQYVNGFYIYHPKKPSIPSGAIELADYNVMADYSVSSAGSQTVAPGVLRKASSRELTYFGTWAYDMPNTGKISGQEMGGSTNGGYFEFTFLGTGFELRGDASTAPFSSTNTVSLQNLTSGGSLLTLNSTNFPGLTATNIGGWTFTYASGNLNQSTSTTSGSGLSINGLTYGLYKVRVTNGTTNQLKIACVDVISKIHAPKNNTPGSMQNLLAVGSNSIGDSRKFGSNQITLPKNWASTGGITSNPPTVQTSYMPAPDMSVVHKSETGLINVAFAIEATSSTTGLLGTQVYIDGRFAADLSLPELTSVIVTTNQVTLSYSATVQVPVGIHNITVYWKTSTGTLTASGIRRSLSVRDV
jgi:hypothetical protein